MSVAATWVALLLVIGPADGDAPTSSPHFERPRPTIAFDAAIDHAERMPSLATRERAVAVRRGLDPRITGTVSQPQILVQPGMRVLPGERRSFAGQLTFMQSWNVAGLGKARRAAASTETAAFDASTRAQKLGKRIAAARAWIDLHAVERQLELARHEAGLAEQAVTRTAAAVEGGVLGRGDLAQARAYAASAAGRVLDLEGRAHDLGLALAQHTASDPMVPLGTHGAAPVVGLPDDETLALRFAEVERLPAAAARRLEVAAARANAVEQARAARGTQITAGGQLDRDDPDGLLAYAMVGVSFAGRGAGRRARGQAVLDRATLEATGLDESRALASTLASALHELHHSRAVLAQLVDGVVPELEATLDAAVRRREAGEATAFEELASRRALADAQIERAAAEAAVTWAEVHAWLLWMAMAEEPR